VPDDPTADQIRLTLPAAPEFVRIARLTCAGLATRTGMGYDDVEDLRIAVGEACSLLIGAGERSGSITMTFTLLGGGLDVEAHGDLDGDPGDVDAELSDQILEAVADEHEIDLARDRVRVAKRRSPIDA